MLAAVFDSFGGPEVLHVAERRPPGAPRGDEILVDVAASSVNGTDLGLRRGDLKVATLGRMPFVPGFDLAGRVVACGLRVTAFRPGDRVLALLGHTGGAQAQQVRVRQGAAALVPNAVDDTVAAALPLAGLTALQALYGVARLGVRNRPRVLVLGASGGIGAFGVQLARLAGGHVTAVTSAPGVDFARRLGADAVLDRGDTDWRGTGERFDVVLDAPAVSTAADADRVLVPGGTLVTTKPLSAAAVRGMARARFGRTAPGFAAVATAPRSVDLARLVRFVLDGALVAPVDRVLPLAEVAAAHRLAEIGALGALGKIVVRVAG